MPSIEGHGYSPQCLETTRKRRFEDVDPKVLLARPHESDHWNHVFEFVDKADKAACEQRKEALDRLYQIAFLISSCLSAIIFDSYNWIFGYSSFIATALCPRSTPPFLPFSTAVTINTLWLLSLLLSVSTFLLCCVCQRYLQRFLERPQFDVKHLLAFRQMQYNAMRRCKIFDICDVVHLLIPLAALLWFSGLILLLKSLNHPHLYVIVGASSVLLFIFLFMGLHPFFWSLFAQHFISSFSPFNSPFSWLLFKLGHSLIFRASHGSLSRNPTSYPELNHPPLKRMPLEELAPQALTSRDWLEQDCSNFFHNSEAIDIFLADALVWVDSNPTIEKNSNLVASIYYCICDLKSPGVFEHLEYGFEIALRGLAKIFHAVATRPQMDKYDSRAMASTLWLQKHVDGIGHFQLAVAQLSESNLEEGLSSDYHPINSVRQLLILARNGLRSGTYLEGTFNMIRLLVLGKQNMIIEDGPVQRAISDILDEGEQYFKIKTCKYDSRAYGELQEFIRAADDIRTPLPKISAQFIDRAHDVYDMARQMLDPTRSDSSQSILVPSRSPTLVEHLALDAKDISNAA